MNEKVKNIILGTIYSVVLFLILSEFIGRIVNFFEKLIYPQEGKQLISMIPGLISMVVTIILSIVAIYLIIHFITLARINNFLKPNKFKVIVSIIVLVLIFGSVIFSEFGLFHMNYYLKKYLLLNSNMFGFEFMELLFPIVGYYLIFCTIDYFMKRKQGAIQNA